MSCNRLRNGLSSLRKLEGGPIEEDPEEGRIKTPAEHLHERMEEVKKRRAVINALDMLDKRVEQEIDQEIHEMENELELADEKMRKEVKEKGRNQKSVKEVVEQIDASTPKDKRNDFGRIRTGKQLFEDEPDLFPVIEFAESYGKEVEVNFSVNHVNNSAPTYANLEFMWIRDVKSGTILHAKKFRKQDIHLEIAVRASSGQELMAASKDDQFGIWQGTFFVP